MNIRSRLARLELRRGTLVLPWLVIGRSDRTHDDAIGFEGYPLSRAAGEPWDAFNERAQQWADAQTEPHTLAMVVYRD